MSAHVFWAVFCSSRRPSQIGPTADFHSAAIPPPIFSMVISHSVSLSKIGHYFCMPLYVPMSSSVAFWAQTQNLMTYLSLTEAGTMWSLPDALMVDNSFWFSSSEPRSLKQTNPSYIKRKEIDMKFDLRIQTTWNIIIGICFMISTIHEHEYASHKISLCTYNILFN